MSYKWAAAKEKNILGNADLYLLYEIPVKPKSHMEDRCHPSLFFCVGLQLYLCQKSASHASSVCVCQGSDSELKGEKDVPSDGEAKADSGVPDVPAPADDTPEVLNKALSGLSSRY